MSSKLKSLKFLSGFVCGAAVSTGSCVAGIQLYLQRSEEHNDRLSEPNDRPADPKGMACLSTPNIQNRKDKFIQLVNSGLNNHNGHNQ